MSAEAMRAVRSGDDDVSPSFTVPDFPANAWYIAAWDIEVTRSLLPRRLCGRDVVLYRSERGVPVALEDACWHRLFPLSKGCLRGDTLVCGYHGLEYDTRGRCTYMPAQETVNPVAMVHAFPVVERHRFVWFWPGDPSMADPSLVPDLHWNHDPQWAADGEVLHVACNYKLVIDNLMDLTHETYVHGSTIGNEHVPSAPFEVQRDGEDRVTVTRWILGSSPPPLWATLLGKPGPVDRWQIINYRCPSTIVIDVGVAPSGTGAPAGDRSQGVGTMVLNSLTPEGDASCHYFWSIARDFAIGEQRITSERRAAVHVVFGEDKVALEAQQRAIDAHPDKDFYNLNIDAGAMWARRLIDAKIAAEARTPPTAAVGGR